jgi:hypothetical protein
VFQTRNASSFWPKPHLWKAPGGYKGAVAGA